MPSSYDSRRGSQGGCTWSRQHHHHGTIDVQSNDTTKRIQSLSDPRRTSCNYLQPR